MKALYEEPTEKRFKIVVVALLIVVMSGFMMMFQHMMELEARLQTVEQSQIRTVRAVGQAVATMERMGEAMIHNGKY